MTTTAEGLRTSGGFDTAGFQNEAYDRLVEIKRLTNLHAPDLQVYFGVRPLFATAQGITFPCVFLDLEPTDSLRQDMIGTAKTIVKFKVKLHFFVFQQSREDLLQRVLTIAEFYKKLFSNNALGDLQGGNPPSNKYIVDNGFWEKATILGIRIGKPFLSPTQSKAGGFGRGGEMVLELEDRLIK